MGLSGRMKSIWNPVADRSRRAAEWLEQRRTAVLCALLAMQILGLTAAFFCVGVTIFPDSASYMEPAQSFLKSGVMADFDGLPTLFRTPGYLLMLAAVYWTGGGNTLMVLLQMVMCVLIGLMIDSIIRNMGGSAAAGLTGLLFWVLHLENYDYTMSILTEIPFAFFCAAALYFLCRFRRNARYRDILLCIVTLNYALLIRPQLMYYSILAAAVLIVASVLKKVPWKITLPYVCLFLICFGGWCARNQYHFGDPQYTFIRYKDYFEYYAPNVYMEVEKVSLEESKEYFDALLDETFPDHEEMDPVKRLYAISEIGKTYIGQHVGAFLIVNIKGLFQEMFAPGVRYINTFGLPAVPAFLLCGFFAFVPAVIYVIYAAGFFRNLKVLTWFDWLIFLTNVYLMASTAVVGYSRFRMAFYAPCVIGALLCWRKELKARRIKTA